MQTNQRASNTENFSSDSLPDDFTIAVIGLGMIGGSMAYKLRSCGHKVIGCDLNPTVMEAAVASGAADEAFSDPSQAVKNADLIIIATYPDSICKIVSDNRSAFKQGAIITDICGVKSRISAEISAACPQSVYYVGSHPMAGKEVEGFDNADTDLFKDCGFIVVPTEKSDLKSVSVVCGMAKKLGAKRIAVNTPEEHDSIIAYTSDLMHIAASALCLDFNDNMNLAYTAGAFRDCTRIALINPKLWTELLTENANHTLTELDGYIASLQRFRTALAEKDEATLYNLLSTVRQNKIDILSR